MIVQTPPGLKTEATPAQLQWLILGESHHWEWEGRSLKIFDNLEVRRTELLGNDCVLTCSKISSFHIASSFPHYESSLKHKIYISEFKSSQLFSPQRNRIKMMVQNFVV